jgi:hypothetical protein
LAQAPGGTLDVVVMGVDCVDRSFQTDARAKPARPDVGIASDASVM